MNAARQRAARLNRECECLGVDLPAVRAVLAPALQASHEHLFSELPVFVSAADERRMRETVAAVERIVALPRYQSAVLARAPRIAGTPQAARGVFAGFDFHLTENGPRLIEINTNAGGGVLNALAHDARRSCCDVSSATRATDPRQAIVDMFLEEWRRVRGAAPLRHIAIADDDPEQQYLYPEFLQTRQLFESHGFECRVVDARSLTIVGGELKAGEWPIDLVYNRCTDFNFFENSHAALAEACASDLAVITPHPRAHALYADKRNLSLLGDADFLASCGAEQPDIDLLAEVVPRTLDVSANEEWWRERRRWFFKPASGHGSRGSYRGDKLTRKTFAQFTGSNYVAQEFTPPSERHRAQGGQVYKVDVRAYAYAGDTQQFAARLYQGQTTNFRTAGGGFAAVYFLPDRIATLPA